MPIEDMAAYKRAWRAKRKAGERCTTCDGPRDVPGRVRCSACHARDKADYERIGRVRYLKRADEINGRAADQRRAWEAAGMCAGCGGGRDDHARKLCVTCRAAGNARLREQRAARNAAGLCGGCGGPRDGEHSECSRCRAEAAEEYVRRAAKQAKPETRQCTGCGEMKPAADFNKKGPARCRACRELTRLSDQQKRAAAKEAEPDRFREYSRKGSKRFRENNPDRWKAIDHAARVRRQQRIKENGGSFTAEEWAALKAGHGRACLACGRAEPEIKLTPDHVIPVSKGGSNGIENIQPLCLTCNVRKQGKTTDYRIADI